MHLLRSMMDEIGTLLLTSERAMYYSETWKKKLPTETVTSSVSLCIWVLLEVFL